MRILAGDEEATDGSGAASPRGRAWGCCARTASWTTTAIILDLAMRGDAVVWRRWPSSAGMAEPSAHPDPGALSPTWRIASPRTTATRWRRGPARCWRGWASRPRVHRQPLGTLSGGFKLRVLLAQVLVGGADLLLLDEPTNHLDILSIRWLEKFLADYAGCAVVISHDQRFLDNVTTHTLDVDYRTITLYTGSYSTLRAWTRRPSASARRPTNRARRGRDRPQAGLRRALRRQEHQGHPGPEPAQADREDRGGGAGAELAARAGAALRARAPQRPRGAGARAGSTSPTATKRVLDRRVADGAAGRARGHHRPQRPGQVDAAEDRRRSPGRRRGQRALGTRGPGRLFPPGSPRGAGRPRRHRRWRRCGRPVPGETTTFVRGAAGAGAVLGRRRRQEASARCRAASRRG